MTDEFVRYVMIAVIGASGGVIGALLILGIDFLLTKISNLIKKKMF